MTIFLPPHGKGPEMRKSSPGPIAPPWDQRQRFMLLEARLIWAGAVTAGELRDAFDISTGKVEKDFARYCELCPENLRRDAQTGVWLPTDAFEPRFLRGTAEELLAVLRHHDSAANLPLAMAVADVASEILEPPTRSFDVRVLARINTAIREQRALEVAYQSMNHPEPRSIVIAPHVLVFTRRWHARAWSETHQAFRDFLLSRMCGLPQVLGAAARQGTDDWDWQHHVSVKIAPHPSLTSAQKKVVEQDYGMRHGLLEKRVRLALVPYYLRLLHVGPGDIARSAAEQQIVLLNTEELRSFDRLA